MNLEDRQKAIGWGASFGIHVVILILVAMTGLFNAVSTADRPVDVDVYEIAPAPAAPTAAAEPAAAAPPPPSIDEIVVDKKEEKPEPQEQPKEPEKKQETAAQTQLSDAPPSDAPAHPSDAPPSDAPAQASNAPANNSGLSGRDSETAKRVSVPPVFLSGSAAAYPESLRAEGAEGSVTLSLVVGTDGSVESATVVSSSGYPAMDAAAQAAAYTYRFTPAENAYGEPVRASGSKTIRFHINGAD